MDTYNQKFWPMNWRRQELPELTPGEKSDERYIASKQAQHTEATATASVTVGGEVALLRRRIAILERQRDDLMDCMRSLQSCVDNDRGLWMMIDKVIKAFEEELK